MNTSIENFGCKTAGISAKRKAVEQGKKKLAKIKTTACTSKWYAPINEEEHIDLVDLSDWFKTMFMSKAVEKSKSMGNKDKDITVVRYSGHVAAIAANDNCWKKETAKKTTESKTTK